MTKKKKPQALVTTREKLDEALALLVSDEEEAKELNRKETNKHLAGLLEELLKYLSTSTDDNDYKIYQARLTVRYVQFYILEQCQ